MTSKLPLWLAPNLITLVGLMALVSSYLISAYYTPDFEGAGRAAARLAAWQSCKLARQQQQQRQQ